MVVIGTIYFQPLLLKTEVLAVIDNELPVKPKGTPLPDQVTVTLDVLLDQTPLSQVIVEPVRAEPIILGSVITLGKALFCFDSLTNRVGIPILLIVSM